MIVMKAQKITQANELTGLEPHVFATNVPDCYQIISSFSRGVNEYGFINCDCKLPELIKVLNTFNTKRLCH